MQISRLLQMTYILLEKGTVTAPELAERFEVSVLSAARLPDLGEAFSKLSSLFRKNSTSWIEVDFSPWGSGQKQKELYPLLKQAVLEHTVISFTYLSAAGEHISRKAAPMKLLFKNRAWYVETFCFEKNAPRTFKITRMSNVQLLDGDGSQFSELQQEGMGAAGTSGEEIKVNEMPRISLVLKIEPAAAYRIVDEFREEDISKQEDGSFRVTSAMPSGEWLIQYLLSYGDLLEVVEPAPVRLEMKTRTAKMAGKYLG